MASYKNYQNDGAKHSSKIDLFKITRNRKKNGQSHTEHFENKMHIWVSFYRQNPHRFAKDYLNVNLKLFQVILLWAMMHHNYFIYIGSRGAGKSFLSAIFLVIRCILYPGTKVVIAAGVKSQAINVLLKIQDELMPNAPLLQREIKSVDVGLQKPAIKFHNGSIIRVVAATDSARSLRANLILVDEFRMVKKEIVDTVLKKFLTSPRNPGYMDKEEYKDLDPEENKQMYLSSAWYKNHWSYDLVRAYFSKMIKGAPYFVAHVPYQVGLRERIYTKSYIHNEMTEDTFNEISWMMEMEAKWFGESEKAYFKFADLESNRKEPVAFYPQETLMLTNDAISNPKKEKSEIRILGVDIAMIGGQDNDASAFSVLQLKPNGKNYERNVVYLETLEGSHSESQAIRIRQLMSDFDIDYVAFDIRGVGIGVLDSLMSQLFDEERGEKYEPITLINDEQFPKYAERCTYHDAKKQIFAISATKELNMVFAGSFSDRLKSGHINMLIKEQNAVEKLQRNRKLKFSSLDPRVKAELLLPFAQIELLTNEMLNLETIRDDNGLFKLVEQGKMRKDRYTSVSYANYYADILERQNLRNQSKKVNDASKFAVFRKPKII